MDVYNRIFIKVCLSLLCLSSVLQLRRPFGIYILVADVGASHTAVQLVEKPEEALQMLFMTLNSNSPSALSTGRDILREHNLARYISAVKRIDMAAPLEKGSISFPLAISEARNMPEFLQMKWNEVQSIVYEVL